MKPYQKDGLLAVVVIFSLFGLNFICLFFGEGPNKQLAYFGAGCVVFLVFIYWGILKR